MVSGRLFKSWEQIQGQVTIKFSKTAAPAQLIASRAKTGTTVLVPDPIVYRKSPQDIQVVRSHDKGHTVKWTAPLLDGSGYAEASRNYVAALYSAEVDVVGQDYSFDNFRADHSYGGIFAREAIQRKLPYSTKVIFMPPHHYKSFIEPDCYNIGLFDWEMEQLPEEWTRVCNRLDEIWVPCQWTADAAKKSGVNKPINVFGHCASPSDYAIGVTANLSFPGVDTSWFKFYSIFQWSERKNPEGLLKAYLTAFTDKDPVILILKTYAVDYSEKEQAKIIAKIEQAKKEIGGDHQPKILLILGMMSRDELLALHRIGDCFVLIHRAEGWGLPHFEACMMGKPVITTGYSANLEFTKPEHSYLVDYKKVKVGGGMPWFKWFCEDMEWADPDVDQCREYMRHVFRNKSEAKAKGQLAQKFVTENFSWEVIGSRMKERLAEVTVPRISKKPMMISEFGGGLGDVITLIYNSERYSALEKLPDGERAMIIVMSHNPHAKELFLYHPKVKQFDIRDVGFWWPWEDEGKRAQHKLPPPQPLHLVPPQESIKFYTSPKDDAILDTLRTFPYIVVNACAGGIDRNIPAEICEDVVRMIADEGQKEFGFRAVIVGRQYNSKGRFEHKFIPRPGIVDLTDRLSVPGTIELIARSQGVFCCHSAICLIAWYLKKPVYLLYPNHVKVREFDRPPHQYTFGKDFPTTLHTCFENYTKEDVRTFMRIATNK